MFRSSTRPSDLINQTTLIISGEKIDGIMKVKSLEESRLLIIGVSKTIRNVAKEQKRGFLVILLVTLVASLLENPLTGKETIRPGIDTITAGQDFAASSFN